MKHLKRLFISSILMISAFITFVVGGLVKSLPTKNVHAASNLNVSIEVYKLADYNTRISMLTSLPYDIEVAKFEVAVYNDIKADPTRLTQWGDGYTYDEWGFTDADDWWNGVYVTGDSSMTAADYDNYYATLGSISTSWTNGKTGPQKKTYSIDGLNQTYSSVAATVKAYEDAGPKKEFLPGDDIVIMPKVQGDNVGMVELYFDALFPSTDGSSNLVSAADAANVTYRNELLIMDNESWDVGAAKTFTTSTGSVSHPYVRSGGEFATYSTNQATGSTSDSMYLIGIQTKIDSSADGSFEIAVGNTPSNNWITVDGNGSYTPLTGMGNITMTSPKTVIEVAGASNVAGASGVSVDGTALTKDSTGITIGSDTYELWKASSQTNTTGSATVNIAATAAKSGKILSVVYSDDPATLFSGTAATGSGPYTINLAKPGDTTYAAIKIQSADNTTTNWVIVTIPVAEWTVAYLDGSVVNAEKADGTSLTITQNPASFISGASPSNNKYTIKVSESVKFVSFKPTFDVLGTYSMTCTVDGTTVTTGNTVKVDVTSKTKVNIVVTAQDGTTTQTYEYTIDKLSDAAALSASKVGTTNATKNASGITIGSNTYDLWEATAVATGTSSVNFTPTADASGKIKQVLYGTNLSTLLTGGTSVSGSAPYSITLGGAGTTTYVATQVESASGSTTDWVITSIPVKKYNKAELTSYTATVNPGSTGTTTLVANPAAFNSSTLSYTLSIPADATGIDFTPTFDVGGTYGMTCTVNGNTATSGQTFTVAATTGAVTVVVKAQDGTTTKTYTFTFATLKNDASINFNITGYTPSVSADGLTYTYNNVPYSTASLNFTATNANAKSIVYNGSPVGSGKTITLNTNGTAASTTTALITVTAESGLTKTYTIEINRDPADTNSTADIDVYANDGTAIAGTWTGDVFTATNECDIAVTGFYIIAKSKGTNATMKFAGVALADNTASPNQAFGTAVGRVDLSKILEVKAEDGSTTNYTIKVSRRAYDTDTGFSYQVFDDSSNDITSMFVADAAGTTITNSASLLDTKIKYITIVVTTDTATTYAKIGTDDKTGISYKVNTPAPTVQGVVGTATYKIEPEAAAVDSTKIKNITFKAYMKALEMNAYIDEVGIQGTIDLSAQKTFTSIPLTTSSFDFTIDKDTNGNYYTLDLKAKSSRATIYWTQATTGFNSIDVPANEYLGIVTCEIDKMTYVKIVAEDGTTYQLYTVDVKNVDKREIDPEIASWKIKTVDYLGNENYIPFAYDKTTSIQPSITVPFTVVALKFEFTYKMSKTTLKTGNTYESLTSVTNKTYKFQSQAENTDYVSLEYSLNVTREAGHTGSAITDIKFNGVSDTNFTATSYKFPRLVGRNDSEVTLDLTVSDGASYTATFDTYSYQSGPFKVIGLTPGTYTILTVVVESEVYKVASTGTPTTYQIYIFNADTDISLGSNGIQILDTDENGLDLIDASGSTYAFNAGTKTNPFTISYTSNNPYILVDKPAGSYFTVSGDGAVTITKVASTVQTKKATVEIVSEYAALLKAAGFTVPADQKDTYVYNFTRNKASTVNALTALSFTFDTANSSKDCAYNETQLKTTRTFKFENLGTNPSVFIEYTKKDASAVVTGLTDPDNGTATGDSYESVDLTTFTNGIKTIELKVTSESGATATYEIILAKGDAVLDTNSAIKTIQLWGDVVTDYLIGTAADKPADTTKPFEEYKVTKLTYNVVMRASNNNAKLLITPDSTKAKIQINGSDVDSTTVQTVALDPSGSTTITITCIPQDASAAPSTVTINITLPTPDTDSSLKGLNHAYGAITGSVKNFAPGTKNYTVNVPNGITEYTLLPTPNSSYATCDIYYNNTLSSGSPLQLNVGSNKATVTVKAEDGTSTTYDVTVIRDDETKLSDLTVEDPDGTDLIAKDVLLGFDPDVKTYTLADVPYAVDSLVVTPTVAASDPDNVKVTVTGNTNLQPGKNNQIIITIEAASGAKIDYMVNVKRESGKTDNEITSYITEGGETLTPSEISSTNITYVVPRNTDKFQPVITVSDGATWKILGNVDLIAGEANTKQIEVLSEVGAKDPTVPNAKKTYTVIIYTCDIETSIDDIELLDAKGGNDLVDLNGKTLDYSPLTGTYSFNIPYSTTSAYIQVTPRNALQKIYIDSNEVTANKGLAINPVVGTNTYKVYIMSEYGVKSGKTTGTNVKGTEYIITIVRESADDDARLATLDVKFGSPSAASQTLTPVFDPDTKTYTLSDIGSTVTKIYIDATVISVGKTVILSGTGAQDLNATTYDKDFAIVTQAESGKKETYTVSVHRLAVVLEDENNINFLEVSDDQGKNYIDEHYVWTNSNTAAITIDSSATSITIEADRIASSKSTVYFTKDGVVVQSSQTKLSYKSVIDASMVGTTVEYTVYAISENGTKGDVYTVQATFVAKSSDATLSAIIIDGVALASFDPSIKSYKYKESDGRVSNSKGSVLVAYKTSDTKAKATISSGKGGSFDPATTVYSLIEGENQIVITVVAEDKVTTSTYTIDIVREDKAPYLTNLTVGGGTYKLTTDGTTPATFNRNPSVSYIVTVGNAVSQVALQAYTENVSYEITSDQLQTVQNGTQASIIADLSNVYPAKNRVEITVKNTQGVEVTYVVEIIRRAPAATDTSVTTITLISKTNKGLTSVLDADDGYVFNVNENNYQDIIVDNNKSSMDINAALGNPVSSLSGDGATYKILNNKDNPESKNVNLHVGLNIIVMRITSSVEEGAVTRDIIFNVTRKAMEIEVINDAVKNYELETVSAEKLQYTLNLGSKKASALTEEEYISYISWDKNVSDLEVTFVTDITKNDVHDVVMNITDGDEVKTVTIHLNMTQPATSLFDFADMGNLILWLILLIAIALLIVILITVNKDKYGTINKSRKRAR